MNNGTDEHTKYKNFAILFNMIKVQNLTKKFGDKLAVQDVSFTIQSGEIFTLIGPNSSGKTTIVKNILGLLEPTGGSIEIEGCDIVQNSEEAKRVLGYIPDEPTVWSSMTGEEFLYFTQALYDIPFEKREEAVKKLLPLFNLEGVEKNSFEEYSRGNKQKMSILAALSHEPKVLVVDEPIVGLDPSGAEIAKKIFTDFAKRGGSVLLVTHTLGVAEEISDRIGFLKEGKLVVAGTMAELRQKAGLSNDANLEEIYKKLAE